MDQHNWSSPTKPIAHPLFGVRSSMAHDINAMIQNAAVSSDAVIDCFQLGLTWSYCKVKLEHSDSIGFAMSPQEKTRLLAWPGTIAGKKVRDICPLLNSWDNFDATLALAACNAAINHQDNALLQSASLIPSDQHANLSVFAYFKPKLKNKKIAIIGRYPKLDSVLEGLDVTVIERIPQQGDLPDTASEYILPQVDWVFLTSTSIINKTFTRLVTLSKDAVTVLMGPSTPWLETLSDFNVDFIAGVKPTNPDLAMQIAMEGGGTRLFDGGVQYAVANVSQGRLQELKQKIAATVEQRDSLKAEMETWYQQGNSKRFPKREQLEEVDSSLSKLDTAYKRLWDANNA